jgi:hypothetical protein
VNILAPRWAPLFQCGGWAFKCREQEFLRLTQEQSRILEFLDEQPSYNSRRGGNWKNTPRIGKSTSTKRIVDPPMRRTYNKENPEEFELIREPAHIKAVTEKLQAGSDGYFAKFLRKAPVLEMARTLSSRFKVAVEKVSFVVTKRHQVKHLDFDLLLVWEKGLVNCKRLYTRHLPMNLSV